MFTLLNSSQQEKYIMTNLFDAMHEGVKIVDKNGDFVFINRSAEKNMGIVRENWIGKNLKELLPNSIISNTLYSGTPQIHKNSAVIGKNFIVNSFPFIHNGEVIGAISTHKSEGEMKSLITSLDSLFPNKHAKFFEKELDSNNKYLPIEMNDYIVAEESPLIVEIKKLKKLSPTDISILIRGESGVGKELIAKGIHDMSNRADKPYITINCAAIPESLLESELFGYDEGAFTGASKKGKKGKFELANTGTIFLDEIGDMSYHLQAKLLRVLQQKELVRIGGSETINLDIRVITATNRNLEAMITENKFREDLYYRIKGFMLNISPLRERKIDIEALIHHFLNEFSVKYNKQITMSQEAHDFLLNHPLPGNTRELISAIEHGFILTETDEIKISDLPGESIVSSVDYLNTYQNQSIKEFQTNSTALNNSFDFTENIKITEVNLIIKALKLSNNNRSQAIKMLGITRQTFYTRLKKYENELSYYLNK